MIVIENAPAKINIGLKITGKRDNGYHNILSIFQTVDLYDKLVIDSSLESELKCSNPQIPTGPDNLVLRAEELIRKRFDILNKSHFTLTKRIPSGAGLAGGSSDAAAALRGLRTIYKPELSDKALEEIAISIGSDVPFLIRGGTAIVSSMGEVVKMVEWPFDLTYVLVYPKIAVSTSWAYGSLKKIGYNTDAYMEMTEKLTAGVLKKETLLEIIENDFEETVFKRYPNLGKIKKQLLENGACKAIMSGSGSTMFGIFDNHEKAVQCAEAMKHYNYDIYSVRPC